MSDKITPAIKAQRAYRQRRSAKLDRYERALREIADASPLSTAEALSYIARDALQEVGK